MRVASVRRGRPRPPVAGCTRPRARRTRSGWASRCLGRRRRDRRRCRCSSADGHDERLARCRARVLPPRGLAASTRGGRLPRRRPRAGRVADGADAKRGDRCDRPRLASAHRTARARSIRAPRRRATSVSRPPTGRARRRRLRRLLSFRTVTYKALCAASQLAHFYPDLEDAELPFPSRSSISASRRTPSRAGSARSGFGSSATTARSARSTATSHGWRRGFGHRRQSPASRLHSITPDPTRRSSTTRSTSSCAGRTRTSRERSRSSSACVAAERPAARSGRARLPPLRRDAE